MKKFPKFIINISVFIICIVSSYFISQALFVVYPILGVSMEPTIHDLDNVFLLKVGKFTYNDIVVIEAEDNSADVIKRIIGLEGDIIEAKKEGERSYIYRNGVKLDEPFINQDDVMSYVHQPIAVGAGEIYVLGDNRNKSEDSHKGKLKKYENIVGKVLFRYRKDFSDIEIIHSRVALPRQIV